MMQVKPNHAVGFELDQLVWPLLKQVTMSKHAQGVLVVVILVAMLLALGIQLFAADVFSTGL
jgi:hypothetical protein